jgi:hypothetical protein
MMSMRSQEENVNYGTRLTTEVRQRVSMTVLVISLILLSVMEVSGFALKTALPQSTRAPRASKSLVGRWRVRFALGNVEKNLVLVTRSRGAASFLLLDTGPDNKPAAAPLPAAWSQLTNDRVSFSGEAELPIGTCCREIGTLIFKGRFVSGNSISGKLIFVTSVDEEESPYQFHSLVGTFTATRIPK